ncbi:hypothetical protein SDC9_123687 [bioreactor metagenome]|uniref:Resolvase/invertase-type recombinase catalytic domain-containing protein n=1 Tax=bioreactor metagenome TaxID=1076179 RepID=A0A645CIE5_9ZZZZ
MKIALLAPDSIASKVEPIVRTQMDSIELKKYIYNDYIEVLDILSKIQNKYDGIMFAGIISYYLAKQNIKEELEHYKLEGVRVKILDIPTTMMDIQEGQEWLIDMINNLLLEVLSTMAEQERINTRTRQAEGIAVAKSQGKHLGRPKAEYPNDFDKVYSQWKAGNITAVKAMEQLKLKKNTFYKLVKEFEAAS